jgi:hypothetical protein
MRKADFYLLFLMAGIIVLLVVSIHASVSEINQRPLLAEKGRMVKKLGLTDLCLFTEASYTRHLSQADLHTPFQDYPMSLEHFPSGSIMSPPEMIRRPNGKVD